MTFAEPRFLLLLTLLPLAALFQVWAWRRRRAALDKLGDRNMVLRLSGTVNRRARVRRGLFRLLGLAALIVALARPQWGSEVQIVEQEGLQIMVVLDVSRSMLAQDLGPDRLARARQTVVDLMERLDGDELGLVLFSGASFIQFPLTSDYGTARSFLDAARPGVISRPGTALGDAIETAVGGFDAQRASQKVILVLTDGESHDDDPVASASNAAAAGIVIYAIGFGTSEGEPIPEYNAFGEFTGYLRDREGEIVLSRLNEAVLQQVATAGNGRYYRASPAGTELDSFAGELGAYQQVELTSRFQTRQVERFQLFLAAAVLCLLLAELVPERTGTRGRPHKASFILLLLLLPGCTANEAVLLQRGNEAFDAQQYPAALLAYTEAQQVAPELAEPVYNAANTRYRQDEPDDAQQLMQQALALADDELAQFSHYNLGNFHFDQRNFSAAIEAYKEALRLDPDDYDAKHNLELALQELRATAETQQEQPDEQGEQSAETPDSLAGESGREGENEQEDEREEPASPSESASGQTEESETGMQEGNTLPQGLTPEQARQLLNAIGQNSETLQERLQRIYVAPGGPAEKEW